MIEQNTTVTSLQNIIAIFPRCAFQCVDFYFGKHCDRHGEWEVVKHLSGDYDRMLSLGCANDRFQAIINIGIDLESIKYFAGNFIDKSEACDIFGEFANNYCALLMDTPEFTARFGILNQSMPILYAEGRYFLPFISGIQGKVYCGDSFLYIGFSIKERTGRL